MSENHLPTANAPNASDDAHSQSPSLPLQGTRILALTPIGAYGGFNTSTHRIQALRQLGADVHVIDSEVHNDTRLLRSIRSVRHRLFRAGLSVPWPDSMRDFERLAAYARTDSNWDIIWLEKAVTIDGGMVRQIRKLCPSSFIVGFSVDDMNGRHNQTVQWLDALPEYDVYVTTKTYNLRELKDLGCRETLFIGNGYDADAFRPVVPAEWERPKFVADVGFIGSYEHERAQSMLLLAKNGINVRIWGGDWHKMTERHPNLRLEMKPLHGDDYCKACNASSINLGFLRKINRDQQTTRSVEIPACGGFMLAERTREHQELFVEGQEAEFFASNAELLEKCRKYLADPELRQRVAAAGRERCLKSGYSNKDRLLETVRTLLKMRNAKKRAKR